MQRLRPPSFASNCTTTKKKSMRNQGNAAPSNYLAKEDNSYRKGLRGVTFGQRTGAPVST